MVKRKGLDIKKLNEGFLSSVFMVKPIRTKKGRPKKDTLIKPMKIKIPKFLG